MDKKPGNKWQKLPAAAEALSKLLLPLVIAGVGVVFSYIQHRSDVEQRKADRVTSFIKHLASDNAEEKELALRVMNVLIDEGQLPSELGPALISSAGNSNKTISQLSQGAITKLARTDSSLKETFVKAANKNQDLAENIQARVFIHIDSDSTKTLASTVEAFLEKSGFSVPGIEKVDNAPHENELRYFRENEESQAARIVNILNDAGLKDVKPRIVKGYEDTMWPKTYELWFGASLIEGEN